METYSESIKILIENISNIHNYLREIQDIGTSNSNLLISSARNLGQIGAIIITCIISANLWIGRDMDFDKLGRILIISIGLGSYSALLGFLNGNLDTINNSFKGLVGSETNQIAKIYEKIYEEDTSEKSNEIDKHVANDLEDAMEEADKDLGVIDSVKEGINNIKNDIMETVSSIYTEIKKAYIFSIQSFILILATLAIAILDFVRTTFLIILSIGGILTIGMSLIPGFNDSFFSWLKKYINTYLWLGVGYLVEGILGALLDKINNTDINNFDDSVFNGVLIFLSIAHLIVIMLVPTLTNWLISSSVSSGASKFKNYAAKASGKLV